MTNKRIRYKRIVLILVAVLLLFILGRMSLQEMTKITETPIKSFQVSQEDIISSGQEIIIKSFDEIQSLKWISDDELLIQGSIDSNFDKYLFDMISYELKIFDEEEYQTTSDEEYEIINDIPEIGLLAIRDSSIGLIINRTFTPIIEDISYKGELKYKVSDDMSKLLMYHSDKGTIVTYNFEKAFYRTINTPLDENVLVDFDARVQISPVGGYVSVEYHDDIIEESYFRIYGADSGRLYAEDVFGINLSWAPDDSKVSYFYSKEVELLEDRVFNNMSFVGRRIGYYDVEDKSIDYIETLSSENNLISNMYWSDHTLSVITGNISDDISIHSLLSYDFDTSIYNDWQLGLEHLEKGTSIELLDDVNSYILLVDNAGSHNVLKLRKDTQEVIEYGDIKAFDTLEEDRIYYYKKGEKFITADIRKVTVSNGQSQGYIQIDNQNYLIVPNYNITQVGVWLKDENEIRILSVN